MLVAATGFFLGRGVRQRALRQSRAGRDKEDGEKSKNVKRSSQHLMRYIKRPLTTQRRRAASRIELKRGINSAKAASVPVCRWRGEMPTARRVCAHASRFTIG